MLKPARVLDGLRRPLPDFTLKTMPRQRDQAFDATIERRLREGDESVLKAVSQEYEAEVRGRLREWLPHSLQDADLDDVFSIALYRLWIIGPVMMRAARRWERGFIGWHGVRRSTYCGGRPARCSPIRGSWRVPIPQAQGDARSDSHATASCDRGSPAATVGH